MRQRRIEPVMVFVTDNQLFGRRKEIAELALSRQLPSMHSFPDEVEDDGLISYGPLAGTKRSSAATDFLLAKCSRNSSRNK